MVNNRSEILAQLQERLRHSDPASAMTVIRDLHPADIAHLLEGLDEPEKKGLFGQLDTDTASEVISYLSEFSRDQILADLPHRRLGEIVDELESDDAADLLASIPEETAEEILAAIDVRDSLSVRRLLAYEEETAGGIMQAELVALPGEATVAHAINQIRELGESIEVFEDIFVVDARNRLVGQLSLHDLIVARPDQVLSRIMDTSIHPIPVDMDQEEVARIFQRYDLISAPVVEVDGTLMGRITIDDVVDIIEEEASEDVLRMAGTHEDELVYGNQILKISRFRLPWLITNLFGGLVTGYLLWLFKVMLADAIVLITFVPVITAMGGNVGVQSSSITVRGLATGDINIRALGRTILKEVRVGLVMALACGITVGIAAEIWHGNPALGFTVGCAMAAAIVVASLMGTVVPFAFKRLGIDPAVASGPFVTTANDITGILIYLSISTLFLKYIMER
jgi:magnesium transporter